MPLTSKSRVLNFTALVELIFLRRGTIICVDVLVSMQILLLDFASMVVDLLER